VTGAMLEARGLTVGYGAVAVAGGIDLALSAGTVTCLLGPNGVGKTTLFKTLLGLIAPLTGSIDVGGESLAGLSRTAVARQVGYVPLASPPDFTYTVLDLVVMGRTAYLGPFSQPRQADYDIATAALDALGIAPLAERDSTRISGGQRQLVLVARALAQEAQVLVMDEPTASLDLANRILVLDKIRTLAGDGRAVLVSTHEPEHAFAVADRVALLGAGHYFETGPVADMLTAERLTRLYGVQLQVERTPSGRYVVGG
jgi:iron complex transport system ATP-binding protein